MARRHFKYIVRDQYGFVIQNAKVNIYQPGTTTNFLGAAYTAESGGSAVTNPITTNNQGEAEGWFDTSQSVDVQVDDNSDAAYRAVLGSTSTVSFTTFTEKDVILPFISDTVGDISAIDPGDAAAVGTTGRAADAGHQHTNTGLPNAHGASSHSDLTRYLWLPVNDGVVLDGGTLSSLGTAPNIVRTISMADAATSGASWALTVPGDWTSGINVGVEIYFAGATTTSGSVRWQFVAKKVAEGGDVTAGGSTFTLTSQAPTTANLLVVDAVTDVITPAAAGELMLINVRRLGADGADTYAATAHLIGVLLRYTANQ